MRFTASIDPRTGKWVPRTALRVKLFKLSIVVSWLDVWRLKHVWTSATIYDYHTEAIQLKRREIWATWLRVLPGKAYRLDESKSNRV